MARRSREVLFLLPILHEIGRRVRKNVCLATTFVHFHLDFQIKRCIFVAVIT